LIDDKNIQDALKWMAGNQLPSGCYANVGKLLHTAMKVRIHPGTWSPTVSGNNPYLSLSRIKKALAWESVFFSSQPWLGVTLVNVFTSLCLLAFMSVE
jgi:hypothetical protein